VNDIPSLSAHNRISVLVADNTPLTARLIADALRRDRTLSINDANRGSVLTATANLNPDIVVLSEKLEGIPGRGFEVLRDLQAAVPEIRTVILLDFGERDLVVEAFRSGARGVFCRSDSLTMLNKCVHKVYDGQLWVSSTHLEFLLDALSDAPTTGLVDTQGTALLSKREEDVVRWLAEGLTNREIARKLKLSKNTVSNYLFRIFNKLGVSSRVEVVLYAARQKARTKPPKEPLNKHCA
jgi:two-component system nitrate/nitrite response regulator NarL